MNVSLPNDFTPRPYQERLMRYFDLGGKRAVWIVHRRGGKDLTALHQTCKMMHMRQGVYWHVFPSFAQARKALWEGFTKDGKRIMENVFPGFLEPKRKGSIVKRKDEQQMMIELKCGSVWRLIGSDRIELVGAGPVGLVFSEFALSNPKAWNMIRPMLRENEGWAMFITTPRGKNHAKDLYDTAVKDPTWFCELQTLYDTRAYDPDSTIEEERVAGMPEALIKQEYLCDWSAALVGSVYGDLLDVATRSGAAEAFDHDYGNVFTTWDLGMTDDTAIWFWQVEDGGINLIDFYAEHGKPLSHYYDVIENKPYQYIKHWLPHDARQVTLASGVSILNQMLKRWPGQVAVGPDLPLLDGIQAARWMIQKGVMFHPRVAEGLETLRQYHYEYDEEKKIFSNKPAHDWSSHVADAFRYLACVVKVSQMLAPSASPVSEDGEPVAPKPIARPVHKAYNLDTLFKDRAAAVSVRKRI
jgi:phage terminase large subunit